MFSKSKRLIRDSKSLNELQSDLKNITEQIDRQEKSIVSVNGRGIISPSMSNSILEYYKMQKNEIEQKIQMLTTKPDGYSQVNAPGRSGPGKR